LSRDKRVGILGGTFNPPHMGHIALAGAAIRELKLDKVVFIPAFAPPHKEVKDNDAAARYEMTRLACEGDPRFEVSDIEINNRSVSYSVDTLKVMRKKYGQDAELFFIIGSDSVEELESWKDISEAMGLAKFIAGIRPGFPVKDLKRAVSVIEMPARDISSSMIRDYVRAGRPINGLVPGPVFDFITTHKLYKA